MSGLLQRTCSVLVFRRMWLRPPRGHPGLMRRVLAWRLQHVRHRLLCSGSRGGAQPLREARDLQHAYESLAEAGTGIARYLAFYNSERPHQGLGYQMSTCTYFEGKPSKFREGRGASRIRTETAGVVPSYADFRMAANGCLRGLLLRVNPGLRCRRAGGVSGAATPQLTCASSVRRQVAMHARSDASGWGRPTPGPHPAGAGARSLSPSMPHLK